MNTKGKQLHKGLILRMGSNVNQNHWENVYQSKNPDQVSWTQRVPTTSLNIINDLNLSKSASIIDVGGGDSRLVDYLIEEGFENITVLDISAKSLEKAKLRLGQKADSVKWVISDITEFNPGENYDLWHDRAAFHFLTNSEQIKKYLQILEFSATGYLIIATFSLNGPDKCSGLEIKKYSEESLDKLVMNDFDKINCVLEDHITPFDTTQNFLFCLFKRKEKFAV